MDSASLLYIEELAPIKFGMVSLIGVFGDAPHAWGNYFELAGHGRVVNFWYENLKAANRFFKLNDTVKIRTYLDGDNKYVIIDDDRIPKDWYYNKLCFTGTWSPSVDIARYMYEYLGDPTFEFERFTDPEKYYEKRGGVYNTNESVSYVCYTAGALDVIENAKKYNSPNVESVWTEDALDIVKKLANKYNSQPKD